MAYRNAWVSELGTNASQILDSFEDNLKPHDWARALIRGLPNVALAPGNPWKKHGLERIVFDPRFGGSVLLAGIWAIGHFRNQSHGVHDINRPSSINVAEGDSISVSAYAVDRNGNSVTIDIGWRSEDTTIATVSSSTGASVDVRGVAAGKQTFITVTAGTISKSIPVTVTSAVLFEPTPTPAAATPATPTPAAATPATPTPAAATQASTTTRRRRTSGGGGS
jgi:hypothetical protein